MTTNITLLAEVARDKDVNPETLQSMIATANHRYSELKAKSQNAKIDFTALVEVVCGEYMFTDLFEKPKYESACKAYVAKNKATRAKLSLEIWRTTSGKLRVRVGVTTSFEFSIHTKSHWLNGKWTSTQSLSFNLTVRDAGSTREQVSVSVKEAERQALVWLKKQKPKAVR